MAEVAGRLEVIVESSLRGFGKKLKAKIESETKGLAVKVGVELEKDGLRAQVKKKAEEAGAGVKVKIGLELDNGSVAAFKGKVDAIAKATTAKIKVEADQGGQLAAQVAAESKAAEDAAPAVKVPLRAKVAGFLAEVAAARAAAQKEADRKPLDLTGGKSRGIRGRTLMRVALYGSIASLVEPAVGAIGQLIGGLTAMAGATGPAFGTLAAAPVAIGSFVQAMLTGKIATQGLGDAMKLLEQQRQAQARGEKLSAADQEKLNTATKELSKSQVTFLKRLLPLRPEWIKLRKAVAEPIFEPLADQIRPLARDLLPVLQKGLVGTSKVLGNAIDNSARFARTPLFQRQFSGIMAQNNRTIDAGADALGGFTKGFLFFYRAAEPFQRRMDGLIRSTGQWFFLMARENARNGDTARFLDKAGDRLGMLWNVTKQIGGGFRGIFRAGDASGMRLFRDFEGFVTKWNKWSNSLAGQNRMKAWFDSVEPGFREIAKIIRDSGKAMLKWAEDPAITNMLHQIRTELGPALNDLLVTLGQHVGSGVVDLITEIVRTLDHAGPALDIMGDLTSGLASLLGVINDLADANPAAANNIAKIVGALLVLRTGKRLLGGAGGLLGLGIGAKGAAKGGGLLAALGLGGGAAAGGATAGKLTRLLKSPIAKKAGLVGTLLTIVDLMDQGERDFHNYSGAADKLLGGLDKKGRGTAKTIADIKDEFGEGHLVENAGKLGINLNKLARSMAESGTKGKYFKQVMRDLSDRGGRGVGGYFKGLSDTLTFGLANGKANEATEARKDLEKLGRVVDGVRAKTKGLNKEQKAWITQQMTRPFKPGFGEKNKDKFDGGLGGPASPFTGPYAKFPSQPEVKPRIDVRNIASQGRKVGRQLGEAIGAGAKAAKVKMPAPEVDGQGIASQGRKVARQLGEALGGAKIDTRTIQSQANKVGRMLGEGVNKAASKTKVKPPKVDFSPLSQEARAAGKVLDWLGKKHPNPKASLNDQASARAKQVEGKLNRLGAMKPTPKAHLNDMASAVAAKVQSKLDRLGASRPTPTARLNDGASGTIARISGELSALNGKVATTYIRTIHQQINKTTRMIGTPGAATGGPIYGPGTGTSDSILARLSNGEFVIKAAMVKKYGMDLLSRINAGRFASGGPVGFRSGGKVSAAAATINQLSEAVKRGVDGAKTFAAVRGVIKRRSSGRTERAYLRRLDGLWNLAKRRTSLQQRLSTAQAKLTDLTERRQALNDAVKQSGTSYGSLASIASANGGFLAPGFLVGELGRRLTDTKAFRNAMRALRKKGLGEKAYTQIAELGMEEGLPLAKQLLTASNGQIRQINSLQKQIQDQADGLVGDTNSRFYNAGIAATRGLIAGLKKNQGAVAKAAASLAKTLETSMKKALRIHSPSKVTFGIGEFSADGLTGGLEHRRKQVIAKGNSLAADLARSMTPDLAQLRGTNRLAAQTRTLRASAVSASRDMRAAPVPQRLAPLVEQLIIQANTEKEVRSALDEAMFKLRQIRQGGLHADRIA